MTRPFGWIALSLVGSVWAGCTNDGNVVSMVTTDNPAQLQAPPPGHGVQMKTDAFAVPMGTELQSCYFFKVSDLEQAAGLDPSQPIEVHRVQIVQLAGSHHMNLFRVRTIVNLDPANGPVQRGMNGQGPCFVSSNWADWPLLANTQQSGNQDWSYPDGVANEIQSNEWLMLQTHYVNAATQKGAEGQVAINLWTIPATEVNAQLGTLFATDQSIRVCRSNPTPTFGSGCQIKAPPNVTVTIVGANGHFHSRGTEFDMYTWNGTTTTQPPDSDRFYQSKMWSDPPMLHSPELAQSVPSAGGIPGGVWWTCSYQWIDPSTPTGGAITCADLDAYDLAKHPGATPDCCYTFGPQVDLNEHCNAFVYYYPKQDDVTCM
jgi:hypothetical protein